MNTYQVTVTGTWKGVYDIQATSEEKALEAARDNAVHDYIVSGFNCPFDISFDDFNSYIS